MYFAVIILQKTSSLHGQMILGTVLKISVITLSNLHCICKSVIQNSGQKTGVKT